MAKDTKVRNVVDFKGDIVATVTHALNKHGEIRGRDKAETKMLKAGCPHHRLKNNGKVVPTIYNDGKGGKRCSMCGAYIPTDLNNTKEVLDDLISPAMDILNQAKYLAVAVDAGKDTVNYLTATGIQLSNLSKTSHKLTEMVIKEEQIKNSKGKKSRTTERGSNEFGSWM